MCSGQKLGYLFDEAQKLDAEADNDPEDEPYRSKYSSREKLNQLLTLLEEQANECFEGNYEESDAVPERYQLPLLAFVHLLLAKNYTQTDERSQGEQYCAKGLACLNIDQSIDPPMSEHIALSPDCIVTYLTLLNYLGFIFESRSDHEKALKVLQDAEFVYCAFKIETDPNSVPLSVEGLLKHYFDPTITTETDIIAAGTADFESQHTYTIYYLAQVYKNVGEPQKAANYCEKTLVRQLESGKYDSLEWALNAAALSQYYVDKTNARQAGHFVRAHHCLASAEAVFEQSQQQTTAANQQITSEPRTTNERTADDDTNSSANERTDVDESANQQDSDDEAGEKRRQTRADIYRCWAKYGLALMDASHERLMDPNETSLKPPVTNEIEDLETQSEEKDEAENDDEPSLDMSFSDVPPLFPQLNLTKYEGQISSQYLTDFCSARQAFLRVQHWLNEAQKFYKIDEHCTDFVEIAQDISHLYKSLVGFESDIDRKCKMHRRRIDMLHEIAARISPSFYQRLCQQLLFECAETSNEMLNLKLERMQEQQAHLEADERQRAIAKINMLARTGIQYFEKFLETFRTPNGDEPDRYSEEAVRAAILAHFYIARWICNYCETTDPECMAQVKEEYEACKEMATLMPLKIDRLRSALQL